MPDYKKHLILASLSSRFFTGSFHRNSLLSLPLKVALDHDIGGSCRKRLTLYIQYKATGYAKVSQIRCPWRAMSWIYVRETGYPGADVAKYLGVTNACVTRMISAGNKQDIEDINLECGDAHVDVNETVEVRRSRHCVVV